MKKCGEIGGSSWSGDDAKNYTAQLSGGQKRWR